MQVQLIRAMQNNICIISMSIQEARVPECQLMITLSILEVRVPVKKAEKWKKNPKFGNQKISCCVIKKL